MDYDKHSFKCLLNEFWPYFSLVFLIIFIMSSISKYETPWTSQSITNKICFHSKLEFRLHCIAYEIRHHVISVILQGGIKCEPDSPSMKENVYLEVDISGLSMNTMKMFLKMRISMKV